MIENCYLNNRLLFFILFKKLNYFENKNIYLH